MICLCDVRFRYPIKDFYGTSQFVSVYKACLYPHVNGENCLGTLPNVKEENHTFLHDKMMPTTYVSVHLAVWNATVIMWNLMHRNICRIYWVNWRQVIWESKKKLNKQKRGFTNAVRNISRLCTTVNELEAWRRSKMTKTTIHICSGANELISSSWI